MEASDLSQVRVKPQVHAWQHGGGAIAGQDLHFIVSNFGDDNINGGRLLDCRTLCVSQEMTETYSED